MKLFDQSILDSALYLVSGFSLLAFLSPAPVGQEHSSTPLEAGDRQHHGTWMVDDFRDMPVSSAVGGHRQGRASRKRWDRADGFTMSGPRRS